MVNWFTVKTWWWPNRVETCRQSNYNKLVVREAFVTNSCTCVLDVGKEPRGLHVLTKLKKITHHSVDRLQAEAINMRREGNQLDATEWFFALIICSTCFEHLYARNTIRVFIYPKYVEQIINTIIHSIAYSWFFSSMQRVSFIELPELQCTHLYIQRPRGYKINPVSVSWC